MPLFSPDSALTLSYWNPQDGYVQVAGQQGNGTLHFQPAQAPDVVFDRIVIPFNFTGATNSTATGSLSFSVGIYTRNGTANATSMSLSTSWSGSLTVAHSGTVNNTNNTGLRIMTIPATGTLSNGQYWIGIWSRTSTSSANLTFSQQLASQVNSSYYGVIGATNATNQYTRGLGQYSATTTAMPASVGFSQINGVSSIALRQPMIYFVSSTV